MYRRWSILYAVLLASFTLYILLDTFVIPRAYTDILKEQIEESGTLLTESDAENSTFEVSGGAAGQEQTSAHAVVTENAYSDENISIIITEYRENDTTIYVADAQISDAAYLRTSLAADTYGRNITEKVSETAENNGAILAINGDYYGARTEGYVIRNGVLYRATAAEDREDLVIWAAGSFEIICESEVSAETLLDEGAVQVLSFGPALVKDGEVVVTEADEVGKAKASNPRTAVGIIDDLHYLMVVADGRTAESRGLSLYELAAFMQGLGAEIAYNLDGGGSSTMVFCGTVINNPTSNGKSIRERSVSDIVYIG